MTDDPLVTVIVLMPVFIIASLITSVIMRMGRFKPFRPLFMILVAPGIVLHEVSHYLMCKVVGINVERIRLLEVDKYWNMGGYVITEPIEDSFFKPLLIAFAPTLVNTVLACLLIALSPATAPFWFIVLTSWLAASFVLGCRPSLRDVAIALSSIVKYPRSFLKEIGCLAIGIVCALTLCEISQKLIGIELPLLILIPFSFLAAMLVYAVLK